MESCGMSLIKYLLFAFNSLFAISGIGIIITGALVLADVGEYNHFMESRILAPPVVLIVAGAIVFIVAFLGCFGAVREKPSVLIAFAACLLIIFILELAVGITAAVYKSEFETALKDTLKKSISNYSANGNEKQAWDNVQRKLKCCGVTSSEDWSIQGIPNSCCIANQAEQECIKSGAGSSVYPEGCYDKLQEKLHMHSKVLIGVGIGIAFVEIIGIVLACWLASSIKKESDK